MAPATPPTTGPTMDGWVVADDAVVGRDVEPDVSEPVVGGAVVGGAVVGGAVVGGAVVGGAVVGGAVVGGAVVGGAVVGGTLGLGVGVMAHKKNSHLESAGVNIHSCCAHITYCTC